LPNHRLRQRLILFDDVSTRRFHLPGIEHPRWYFPRLLHSKQSSGARKPGEESRFDCTLKIDGDLIFLIANFFESIRKLLPGFARQRRSSPTFCIHHVHEINQRTSWRSRAGEGTAFRAQQFSPTFFHDPADLRVRKRAAQSGCGWERVNDISHGAEADNQQALKRMRRHASCAHERFCSMLRMISVAEWSLGSPTISTRPPHSMTASRSGTLSAV